MAAHTRFEPIKRRPPRCCSDGLIWLVSFLSPFAATYDQIGRLYLCNNATRVFLIRLCRKRIKKNFFWLHLFFLSGIFSLRDIRLSLIRLATRTAIYLLGDGGPKAVRRIGPAGARLSLRINNNRVWLFIIFLISILLCLRRREGGRRVARKPSLTRAGAGGSSNKNPRLHHHQRVWNRNFSGDVVVAVQLTLFRRRNCWKKIIPAREC